MSSIVPIDLHERCLDYLTKSQIEALLKAAKDSRNGVRDHLMILMLFRHGLRESELVNLRFNHLSLETARIKINRLKGGLSTEQPIAGDEMRALRRYLKQREDAGTLTLPWLFLSTRKAQISRHTVIHAVKQAGSRAQLGSIWPHMLRHSCGYYLANKGYDLRLIQDYLGHREPRHTAHYTRTGAIRFEGLWD